MSKEIKDLLEKIDRHIIHHTCGYTVTQDLKTLKDYVQQALAKLRKEQPPAGEFTKEWRRKLENAVILFKIGKYPDNWFQSIVTGFREACDIIDTSEAISKIKDKRIAEFEAMVKAGGECCDILQKRIDMLSEGKAKAKKG